MLKPRSRCSSGGGGSVPAASARLVRGYALTRPAGAAGLEHMLPMERPFAWLGSLRPSDAATHTLAKLGPALPQAQRTALEGLRVRAALPLQVSCLWLM